MTRSVKVCVLMGLSITGALTACVQLLDIEDLPEVCGEKMAPGGAPAGERCSGALLGTFPIESEDGEKYGELKIYYDVSSDENCASAHAIGAVYGHASEIKVHLSRCSETAGSPVCTREVTLSDPSLEHFALYHSYAGPISIDAKDQCVYASASILYDTRCARGSTGGAVFCD
jgi:hypothetical protein